MKSTLLILSFVSLSMAGCAAQVGASGGASIGTPEAAAPERAAAEPRAGLESQSPVECQGNDRLEIRRALIDTQEDAIVVSGNCHLVIRDSQIRSAGNALSAGGNARIEVHDSHVEGASSAIDASGNARVSGTNTVFTGPLHKSGNAAVDVGR